MKLTGKKKNLFSKLDFPCAPLKARRIARTVSRRGADTEWSRLEIQLWNSHFDDKEESRRIAGRGGRGVNRAASRHRESGAGGSGALAASETARYPGMFYTSLGNNVLLPG